MSLSGLRQQSLNAGNSRAEGGALGRAGGDDGAIAGLPAAMIGDRLRGWAQAVLRGGDKVAIDRDRDLEARVAADLVSGRMSYGDAALLVFRRICAGTDKPGVAVGAGDAAMPVVIDLAAQPHVERAVLLGLSRRAGDRLAVLQADGHVGALKLELFEAAPTGGGEGAIDAVLAGDGSPCLYMALEMLPGDLGPLEGAAERLRADGPVIVIQTDGQGGDGGTEWRETIAARLSSLGYAVCGGFGQGVDGPDDWDATGALWAFPADLAEAGPALLPAALAKAAADKGAVPAAS